VRWRYTLYVISAIVVSVGLTMLMPLGFSIYYGDGGTLPLVKAMVVTLVAGAAVLLATRKNEAATMSHREGMAVVALGWAAAGFFGALPFCFSGQFASVTDCVFESFSGFTTTGASILHGHQIEALPKGLLMWRSLTHWLGGMGIIVLSLAILPFLGLGGMQLYKAEVPGPTPDKLKPRIKDTAMTLWKVYVLFSLAETILLMLGGMDLFDGLCHTFGTMATGGFSTKGASIGHFDSVYIDVVIIVFMLIAGINFTLHYQMLRGRPLVMYKDPEFRFFAGVFLVFTAFATASTFGEVFDTLGQALRYSSFQVASILTTTGYGTHDYELWPALPQALLLFLMFLGGSAGSTGGGMKCMRIMLLMKNSYRELYKLVHPRAVTKLKLGGRIVSDDVMSGVWGYFVIFLGLYILSSFMVAATGVDVLTSFAAVIAAMGNIGPGLGAVGPAENYAMIPAAAKWILAFDMVLGRLEIYTVIILFVPEFWRK